MASAPSTTVKTARGRGARRSDTPSANKPSQRERLLAAMIALTGRSGYQAVTIGELSTRAGVSRATFYEQFGDKEACMLAAYAAAFERLRERMLPPAPDRKRTPAQWREELTGMLAGLLGAVAENPDAARVLFLESLSAGATVRAERELVINDLGERAAALLDSAPAALGVVDVPAIAVVGALRSVVSRQLRAHGEDELPALAPALAAWIASYARPRRRGRWSETVRATGATQAKRAAPARREPVRIPRGRHRLPAGVVARSHRERIVHATAEAMLCRGYVESTVTDIVAEAAISREVFYEHFENKHEAFLEAQRHGTQEILDAFAAAYFTGGSWPERVYRGLSTLTAIVAAQPALAHLRLVECYPAGPEAVRATEELARSFAVFLEEGHARGSQQDPERVSSRAITGALLAIVQRHVLRGESEALPAAVPQLTYIAVAPFVGAEEAAAEVQRLAAGK